MTTPTDKSTPVSLLQVRHWTDKLFSIRTTRPAGFRFEAGQFARLGLEDGAGGRLWRPYSMVSAPYEEALEFYSIRVPEGAFTTRLAQLQAGDGLLLDPTAYGFLVPGRLESGPRLWLLATGTGLAPFLSLIRDPGVWQRFPQIFLVHSVRYGEELNYRDLLADLPAHPLVGEYAPGLRYQAVVTRETAPGTLHQRIPALLQDGSLEQALGALLAPDQSRVMLCGNPAMVEETRQLLSQRGFATGRRGQPGTLAVENSF